MSLVLVRDDDANATTDPARLARLYAPLLDAGLPVCFAVIPEVALDTLGPDGAREGFLADGPATDGAPATLTRASPMATWLRAHPAQADVLMHGLSHGRVRDGTEFGALDLPEAAARLTRGLAILDGALDRTPRGFVAPWDALSRPALQAATTAFDLVSTGFVDRRRLPPRAWPAHLRERLSGRQVLGVGRAWVARHRGCRLVADTDPARVPQIVASLTDGADVAVLVLHHWHFWRRGGEHPVIRALAGALRAHRVVTSREAVTALDQPGGHTFLEASGHGLR